MRVRKPYFWLECHKFCFKIRGVLSPPAATTTYQEVERQVRNGAFLFFGRHFSVLNCRWSSFLKDFHIHGVNIWWNWDFIFYIQNCDTYKWFSVWVIARERNFQYSPLNSNGLTLEYYLYLHIFMHTQRRGHILRISQEIQPPVPTRPCPVSKHSNTPLVWACHHNADRITRHHVTLHPANNNSSKPPTASPA